MQSATNNEIVPVKGDWDFVKLNHFTVVQVPVQQHRDQLKTNRKALILLANQKTEEGNLELAISIFRKAIQAGSILVSNC